MRMEKQESHALWVKFSAHAEILKPKCMPFLAGTGRALDYTLKLTMMTYLPPLLK